MGKSAKLHKRVPKKLKSSTHTLAQNQVQDAEKRASRQSKATTTKREKREKREKRVLGGADYVTLMMGGRRKAQCEATKLPQDQGT
ncbi:hypothetical protein Ac2012v2_005832 [Leucoagaricus gongylophorus]